MDDLREKTIKGLATCGGDDPDCQNCPYYGEHGDGFGCETIMQRDALSLLKAQEPRVMTLEEAQKWVEIPLESRDPVFYEDRTLERAWWIWNADDRRTYLPAIIGGIGRFWTSRPTDEQRKAAKWE